MRMRILSRAAIRVILACACSVPGHAGELIETDVNLVTALDLSDSIMRHEQWLQFSGMAGAIESEAFVGTIARGLRGRIGVVVFTWSSGDASEVIVPWSLIGSQDEARAVAALLRRAGARNRFATAGSGDRQNTAFPRQEHRTDLSAAIELAIAFGLAAPFDGARTVINISGNGSDNVGDGPEAARDRAIAAGMVINGLAIGRRKGLPAYLREHVQGGANSFVMEISAHGSMVDAMLEKFLRDLLAGREPAVGVQADAG